MKGYQHPPHAAIAIGKWMDCFELVMNKCRINKIWDAEAILPLYVFFKSLKRSNRLLRRRRYEFRILYDACSYEILVDLKFSGLSICASVTADPLQKCAMSIS